MTTIEISAQAEIDKEIQEAIAAAEAGGRRGDGLTGVRDKRRNSAHMVVYKLPNVRIQPDIEVFALILGTQGYAFYLSHAEIH